MSFQGLKTSLIALVLVTPVALGGIFSGHAVDVSSLVRDETGYAGALLAQKQPFEISFYDARGRLTRRKVADPVRSYLAVYDASGTLLRWEQGDALFSRDGRNACFDSMTGENYAERLYLPALPTWRMRGAHRQTLSGGRFRLTWQTPSTDPGAWRTNVVVADADRIYRYHYGGAGSNRTYASGTYVFSYPAKVVLRGQPTRHLCS